MADGSVFTPFDGPRLSSLREGLRQRIASHPLYAGADNEAASTADIVINAIEAILAPLAQQERAVLEARIGSALDVLGECMFEGVNPRHPLWPDDTLEAPVYRQQSLLRDGKGVHLELGAASAWPDDLVERVIAADHIGDFIRLDMDTSCPIDVRASVTSLPFADETVDFISSNSLFEHCPFPHEIIREAFRVLRPGGTLLTKVPFHFVEHRCPGDYLRFTEQFFEDVCAAAGFDQVATESKSTSGVYYIAHQLLKAGVAYRGNREFPAARRAHIVAASLLGLLQGMDDLFDAQGRSLWHTTAALAIKPGTFRPRAKAPDRSVPFLQRYLSDLICPNTGLPLRRQDQGRLASVDGSHHYGVTRGIPDLFALHGFASAFRQRSSSRAIYQGWRDRAGATSRAAD